RRVGERPLSEAGHAGALPALPRARLAGAPAGVRAPLCEPCLSQPGRSHAGAVRGEAPRAAARDPGPADAGRPGAETGAALAAQLTKAARQPGRSPTDHLGWA